MYEQTGGEIKIESKPAELVKSISKKRRRGESNDNVQSRCFSIRNSNFFSDYTNQKFEVSLLLTLN